MIALLGPSCAGVECSKARRHYDIARAVQPVLRAVARARPARLLRWRGKARPLLHSRECAWRRAEKLGLSDDESAFSKSWFCYVRVAS